ncbi:DUF6020 family protein [Lachnospiraceae bacterium 56-18]
MEDRRGVIVRIVCVIIAILSIYILSIYPVSGVILVQSDKWYSSIYILLLAKLLKDLFECKKKQILVMGLSVGFIYALCIVSGQYIYWYGQNIYGMKNSFCLLGVLFLIFGGIIVQFMNWIEAYDFDEKEWISRISDKKFFLLTWFLICLCWVPAFLAAYPGIYSYDATPQVLQLFGEEGLQLSSHHPLLHTLFFGACLQAGELLHGSYNTGLVIYSIIQGLLLSLVFAFVLLKLKKLKAPMVIIAGSFLFFSINPILQIFAFVTSKDVLFSAVFLVLLILLYDLAENFDDKLSDRRWLTVYVAISVLMCLLRNQGIYVFIFMILFQTFLLRRSKQMICINAGIIITIIILNGPFLSMMGIQKGDAREMFSVPMQQMARVYNTQILENEENELIEKIVPEKYLREYTPLISDPVKSGFDTEELKKNIGEYIKLWIKLGIKYPKEYVISFLYGCAGYYYIDETIYWGQYIDFDGILMKDNILNIERNSKFPFYEQYLRNQAYLLEYRRIPVVSIVLHQAFPFWLIVLYSALCFYMKKYNLLVPVLMLFGYWGTLLLGPVTSIRYALPLMVCVPILITFIYVMLKEGIKNMQKNQNQDGKEDMILGRTADTEADIGRLNIPVQKLSVALHFEGKEGKEGEEE